MANDSNPEEAKAPQVKRSKMAPRSDSPPGLEQDGQGNTIPMAQRTQEDQEKARAAQHKG